MGRGGTLRPLAERRFRLLWLGRVSSAAGDALMPVALAFAVLSINRSGLALGGVLAAFTASRVLFTLVGGVVADRFPRRSVMLVCDANRAAVEAFTAAMLLTHSMTLPLFFVTAALFGSASAFFGPASDGLVPQTVSAENLGPANALLGVSRNTLNVFGPLVSGAIIAASGPGWIFVVDAASFVVSAFFLVRLRVDPHARAERSRFLREVRTGYREVVERPWVRAALCAFAISNIGFASFIVLGPLVYTSHFDGARDWGITSACGSVGAIAGAIVSARIAPRRPLYAAFVVSTLVALPVAALANPLPLALVAAAWGIGMGSVALANTWWETTLQRQIPEQVFSRVRSYDILVSFVFMPFGMITFGPIADAVGFRPTLFGAAAAVLVTNLAVAFVPAVRAVLDGAPPEIEVVAPTFAVGETREPGSPAANQVPV